jgi:xanthine/CO dehydrogenase XdhC/CoxF family maturation factor
MLGPRARLERLLAELDRDGVQPSSEDMAKVHGPAGLDLGAETPEEVAVAIVSEILASSRSRAGGHLKDRRAPIHDAHHPAEVG